MFDLPQLSEELSIGENLRSVAGGGTDVVLDTLGRDLLVFLTASVAVTPIAKKFNITPILGYLVLGAILGPHGADIFSNSEADIELGDFGILFLLFSEGLEVSRERLAALTQYLPLGLAQLSLTIGVLTFAFLSGGPEFLERFLPLDASLINIHNPIEALVAAIAGALSTSAFVFPVLKEREWEDEAAGQAATSILLLQDLAVAPLLVILPYISGTIPTDPGAIGLLTAKATLGFGSVLALGSVVLRRIFLLVAETRSTETFVALCLLVAAGMGSIAKSLGLTDTAGAFAAGVLLANTNYRAQIQADILPFKGILLGIFFMDAGSSFDIDLVLAEWPTVLTGAASLLFLKFLTLGLATRAPRWMEPNGLPAAQGFRLALMLAGGGEFAFVVLALAEKLGVLSGGVGGLFTAIVLITMACTPVLGELAAWASGPLLTLEPTRYPELESVGAERLGAGGDSEGYSEETTGGSAEVAHNAVVVCGLGDVGREVSQVLIEVHIAGGLPSLLASPADWAARTANADAAGGDAARDAARDAAGQPALASTSNGGSSRSDGGGGGSSSSSSSGSSSSSSVGSTIDGKTKFNDSSWTAMRSMAEAPAATDVGRRGAPVAEIPEEADSSLQA
uniref:Cation/H+ exchanger transmembrane domain-containing protein n=1 Tax=Haptolina brevifila TaxID=156173 RepID=A0A7S2H7P2_9EUKA